MTTSLMPQHDVATGEPSLFDSLSRLVPNELQREYYRVLAHTRTLNPDDEMLRILEAMGILALITRHTPADIAAERERIQEMLDIHLQFASEAQQRMLEYNQLLESRLAALPSEVEEGLNPEKVSKLLGKAYASIWHRPVSKMPPKRCSKQRLLCLRHRSGSPQPL